MYRSTPLAPLAVCAALLAAACSDASRVVSPGDITPAEAAVPERYTLVDLGPGAGVDINDAGAALIRAPDGAYVWTREGGRVKIGDFVPTAINNHGDVAGVTKWDYLTGQGLIWTPARGERLLASDPAAPAAMATAINDRREITGWMDRSENDCFRVFRWSEKSGVVPLSDGFSGACQEYGIGINDAGAVVAQVVPPDADPQTWIWSSRDGWQPMAAEHDDGARGSLPGDINDLGEVVGTLSASGVGISPFAWRPKTSFAPLGSAELDGAALGLNDRRAVVGYSFTYGGWVWTATSGVRQLEGGIPIDVNNRGVVVGTTVAGGAPHAVLWVPSEEPMPSAELAQLTLSPRPAAPRLTIPAPVTLGARACLVAGRIEPRPCAEL
ncbi:MAG TPA: hypothetical protein VFS05_01150 [Gemmatimonadaceae bacterium]|nr:hypothetical protein [Gemmatimonadaceae bacterium]